MPHIISLPYQGLDFQDCHEETMARVVGKDSLVVDSAAELRGILEEGAVPQLLILDFKWTSVSTVVLYDCLPRDVLGALPVLIVGDPRQVIADTLRQDLNVVGFLPVEIQRTGAFAEVIRRFFALYDALPEGERITEEMFSAILAGIEVPQRDSEFGMAVVRRGVARDGAAGTPPSAGVAAPAPG